MRRALSAVLLVAGLGAWTAGAAAGEMKELGPLPAQDAYGWYAIAVDHENFVYAVGSDKRILRFDPTGNLVGSWGGPTDDKGNAVERFGIAVGSDDNVYVPESRPPSLHSSVERYSRTGTPLGRLHPVDANGRLFYAQKIAADGLGYLYLPGGRYMLDGAYVRNPGLLGLGEEPIAAAADGTVYVASPGDYEKISRPGLVMAYPFGGGYRDIGLSWPRPLGSSAPEGLAVDDGGDVWASDLQNDRLVRFSPEGAPLGECGGRRDGREAEMESPASIAVDHRGILYVADRNVIRRFGPSTAPLPRCDIALPGLARVRLGRSSVTEPPAGTRRTLTYVYYSLAGPAVVRVNVYRRLRSSRARGRCYLGGVAPLSCVAHAFRGRIVYTSRAGLNHIALSNIVSSHRLTPGYYEILVTASDRFGSGSATLRLALRVLPS